MSNDSDLPKVNYKKVTLSLLALVFFLFLISVFVSFDRYVLNSDYDVIIYNDCDPENQSCFEYEECDEETGECEIYYYYQVYRSNSSIPQCDQYSNCELLDCEGVNEKYCREVYND